jgi:hypothetical protein
MYVRLIGAVFSILIICVLGLHLGRPLEKNSFSKSVDFTIKIDPEGSVQEQLAYHQFEIQKYEAAALKEKVNAYFYLDKHQMNEVRQANSRRFQYLKKIEEHTLAIEELKKEI